MNTDEKTTATRVADDTIFLIVNIAIPPKFNEKYMIIILCKLLLIYN